MSGKLQGVEADGGHPRLEAARMLRDPFQKQGSRRTALVALLEAVGLGTGLVLVLNGCKVPRPNNLAEATGVAGNVQNQDFELVSTEPRVVKNVLYGYTTSIPGPMWVNTDTSAVIPELHIYQGRSDGQNEVSFVAEVAIAPKGGDFAGAQTSPLEKIISEARAQGVPFANRMVSASGEAVGLFTRNTKYDPQDPNSQEFTQVLPGNADAGVVFVVTKVTSVGDASPQS